MSKTVENHYGGNWWDRLNNWLAVDTDRISTRAFAWDAEGRYAPDARSLFNNGYVMWRAVYVDGSLAGLFLHLRVHPRYRSQFGLGHKLNGRFGVIFRPWQSDEGAAAGTHGPNYGQAAGFARGTA